VGNQVTKQLKGLPLDEHHFRCTIVDWPWYR